MRGTVVFKLSILIITLGLALQPAWAVTKDGRTLAKELGTNHGLCVVLGDKDGKQAFSLLRSSGFTVFLVLGDKDADKIRHKGYQEGLLGSRLFVGTMDGTRLPLADNLADAVVVAGSGGASKTEMLRVLRPGGVIMGKGKVKRKNMPKGLDAWSHPYHGPDNNPLSIDEQARAPYLTQFLARPYYSPQPQVTVTAGGRIYKLFGFKASRKREYHLFNTLAAFSAWNGAMLWSVPVSEGFMYHRQTLVATPEGVLVADDKSCRFYEGGSGKLGYTIISPAKGKNRSVWKWMALEGGVLYCIVGGPEPKEDEIQSKNTGRGWNWGRIGKGFIAADFPWGFGNTVAAIELESRKVKWVRTETDPIDGRAVGMKDGRIYYFCPGKKLVCRDAKKGKVKWSATDPQLLQGTGDSGKKDGFWHRGSSYLKVGPEAVYLAGGMQKKLVAASTKDGSVLWTHDFGNFHLILTPKTLYGWGWARTPTVGQKFDPLTGKPQGKLPRRGKCTRATGNIDSMFVRDGPTMRYDPASGRRERIEVMRPNCTDGVITSEGLVFWGPWMCDCPASLIGIMALGPAGDFKAGGPVDGKGRLKKGPGKGGGEAVKPEDWPTYRKDNVRSSGTAARVPAKAKKLWDFSLASGAEPTAPVAVGNVIYVSGVDGSVHALDVAKGKENWSAFTGGAVYFPPSYAAGKLYLGSADGKIWVLSAKDGATVWRFRVGPMERRIPVYGTLSSTWPVASGVLVDGDVVYAGAGIANHDGTYVVALEADSGKVKWENTTLGNKGLSMGGHLLLHQNKLYFSAAGNYGPVALDAGSGAQSGRAFAAGQVHNGREMFLVNGRVVCNSDLLYSPEQDRFASKRYQFHASDGKGHLSVLQKTGLELKGKWKKSMFEKPYALALCANAAVVTGRLKGGLEKPAYGIAALDRASGNVLWEAKLPARPVPWGLCVTRNGRVIVTLVDGQILCFG